VFHVSIWGVGVMLGGISPPKPPRGDGTALNHNRNYTDLNETILHFLTTPFTRTSAYKL